ncbi:MAG: sulfotransferase [Anaerolineae bacterium]
MMTQSNPVYVSGANRSGTTLMYALLASHPNLSMVRRTDMWRYFHGQYGDLSQRENFERCLDAMLHYKRVANLEPDPERIRREFWQGEPSYGRLFALFHQHHAERLGKTRWGDKSLHTEKYADQVFAEFPVFNTYSLASGPSLPQTLFDHPLRNVGPAARRNAAPCL